MDILNSSPSIMDISVDAPCRDELIHERPRASVPEPRRMGLMSTQRAVGESYGDPTVKSWSMNHTGVEKRDKVIGERREENTFTIAVSACLFSVTVAAFAVESYDMSSLDFRNEFIPLSTHILSLSQRPVNASNVTPRHWENVAGNAPFKPLVFPIRINVLWFLSLVLILATGLSAALAPQLQQHFSEIPERHGAPHKYASISVSRPPPARAVETALHIPIFLSVFLFIAGLIDFLLSINKTVAFCVLGSIPALPFVCLACTALPSLYPYEARHDSLPRFPWRVSQILGVIVLIVVGQVGDTFMTFCRRFGIRPFCPQQSILVLLPR